MDTICVERYAILSISNDQVLSSLESTLQSVLSEESVNAYQEELLKDIVDWWKHGNDISNAMVKLDMLFTRVFDGRDLDTNAREIEKRLKNGLPPNYVHTLNNVKTNSEKGNEVDLCVAKGPVYAVCKKRKVEEQAEPHLEDMEVSTTKSVDAQPQKKKKKSGKHKKGAKKQYELELAVCQLRDDLESLTGEQQAQNTEISDSLDHLDDAIANLTNDLKSSKAHNEVLDSKLEALIAKFDNPSVTVGGGIRSLICGVIDL